MTQPATGLFVAEGRPGPERRPVPLTGVDVRVDVRGAASRVRLRQSYENRETKPVEAVYVFPAEEGSAVCGFAVTIDGKRHEGRVMARDDAFDDYDDAMAVGHGAFLLDQERPNVLTASVGNLKPGQSVEVELQYVAELHHEGRALRLTIPTTVSPRYVPLSRQNFDGVEDGERVNPPLTTDRLPYPFELEVVADLLSPIRSVESPSHTIRSEIDGSRVRVSLAGDDDRMDRDFVLLLTPSEPTRALSCVVEDHEGERYAIASFRPQIAVERRPAEILFVVDCSGSMGGPSIQEARRTLHLCLHSLEPGDRFEITRFGSRHESLFGGSRIYDEQSLAEADRWVAELRPDLGGTEILAPLQEALGRPRSEGCSRSIVLITDGQVSNEDQVFALARTHRHDTRVFAFGVGPGASEHLVRGIARAGRGAAEMVYPGERIEDKVMRHFERIALPPSSPLRLEWEGLEVEQTVPSELPPVIPDELVTVIARVSSGDRGVVRLRGEIAGRPVDEEAELEPVSGDAAGIIPVLWARGRIRELEEGETWLSRPGSGQLARREARARREHEKAEQELVELGTRYGLLTSATSFVVVEERPESERTREFARLRRIPTALTRGWGGLAGLFESPRMVLCQSLSLDEAVGGALPRSMGLWVPDEPDLPLVRSQEASGSWDIDPVLAKCCHRTVEELRAYAEQAGIPDASRVLATLLALAFLTESGSARSLMRVIKKGGRWLAKATAGKTPPRGAESWEAWADQVIKADARPPKPW